MPHAEVRLPVPGHDAELTVVRHGHYGRPLLAFPSESGSAGDFESQGMLDAVRHLVDAGRVSIFAVDAMDGSGTLTLRTRADEHHVVVEVCDTGAGMTDEVAAHAFEPFFTTKGVGQGTGLGLSQVFGFAKQSDGDIIVESEVGCGTVFTLYLPRAEERTANLPGAVPEGLADGHGTCVLVVEDNPVNSEVAQALLEAAGLRVESA